MINFWPYPDSALYFQISKNMFMEWSEEWKQYLNGLMNIATAIKIKPTSWFTGFAYRPSIFRLLAFWRISALCWLPCYWFWLLSSIRLDLVLAVAMATLTLVMAWLIWILPVGTGFFIALFALAWIGQFYGHKVEGKKPSFFKDLQFLLIGPIWCMDAYLGKILPNWKSRHNSAIMSI